MSAFQKLFNSGKFVLNSSESFLETLSKPLIVYNIFVIALICYDILKKDYYSVYKNTAFLVLGSIFIWLLCFLGFEPVAWVLLSLPVFFIVAVLALLVLTQIIKTDVHYANHEMILTGFNFSKMLGIQNPADETLDHDYSTGFFAPEHPDKTCNRPAHVQQVVIPPPISKKRKAAVAAVAVIPECTTCVVEIPDREDDYDDEKDDD